MTPNTTCDVYRNSSASPPPGNPPDVTGVPIFLVADYRQRLTIGAGDGSSYQFTHIALCAPGTDIRDSMINFSFNAGGNDDIYVPDLNGTRFRVVAVEITDRGLSTSVRRVYLDRYAPTWPTNDL